MKSPDVLTEEFRARGLKVTPQRQRIFRALFEGVDHPTAEAVYAAVADDLPTISLRTVYQTLNDLAAMGEVHQLDLGTGSTRFDTNLEAHHHFVCEVCDRVVDVLPDFTDVQFPVALSDEFCVSSTEIVFRGRCRSCGSELGAPSGS